MWADYAIASHAPVYKLRSIGRAAPSLEQPLYRRMLQDVLVISERPKTKTKSTPKRACVTSNDRQNKCESLSLSIDRDGTRQIHDKGHQGDSITDTSDER